jgi:hypothetical protein
VTKHYIGTKIVLAWNQEKDGKAGYAVKYEDGYISWSPAEAFESAYREVEGDKQALTFGDAIHMLKLGKKVARAGWNGKGMWIGMHKEHGTFVREECGTSLQYADFIVMKTADNKLVPWLASQTDVLAEDWRVIS